MSELVKSIAEVRNIRWQNPAQTWGLVPTMGALHAGHLELVRRALAENDRVAVSIFVNPLQFNQASDLEKYPRQIEHDIELLQPLGTHLIWTPHAEEMYPPHFQTTVNVEKISHPLEGTARPNHFRGVTTVVAKLFNVIQPTRAYFGQKDAQQVKVIQQMVADLSFNLSIVVCPTVREPDGLAMSSRNQRLNPAERQAATVLYQALQAAQNQWQNGLRNSKLLHETMRKIISAAPLARIDYISLADPLTLAELEGELKQALVSMAVYIGEIRLIDNLTLE